MPPLLAFLPSIRSAMQPPGAAAASRPAPVVAVPRLRPGLSRCPCLLPRPLWAIAICCIVCCASVWVQAVPPPAQEDAGGPPRLLRWPAATTGTNLGDIGAAGVQHVQDELPPLQQPVGHELAGADGAALLRHGDRLRARRGPQAHPSQTNARPLAHGVQALPRRPGWPPPAADAPQLACAPAVSRCAPLL